MFFQTSNKITESLIRIGVILPNDKEIYRYGFQQGLVLLLNLFSALAIAIIMGMEKEALVFLGAFIPLRSFAGGFHLNSHRKCYIISMGIISIVLLTIRSKLIALNCYYFLSVISHIVIFVVSPVEDTNKKLDQLEKQTYKRLTRILQSIELCVCAVADLCSWDSILIPVVWAWLILSLLLIVGYLNNSIDKWKHIS